MTFTAVGSFFNYCSYGGVQTAPNYQGAGNLLVVSVVNVSDSVVYATALSGTKATWVLAGVHYSSTGTPASTVTTFIGTVTATGSASIAATWSGTTPGYEIIGHEFSSGAGSWVYQSQGNANGADNSAWPGLTPSSVGVVPGGRLYWGGSRNAAYGAVAGSATGYSYFVSPYLANGFAFNPACTIGTATSPTFADANSAAVGAIIVAEAPAGTGAGVTAQGGAGIALGCFSGNVTGVGASVQTSGGTGTPSGLGIPYCVAVSRVVSPSDAAYSPAYIPYNAATGALSISPPSGYQAGDTLIMAVIAGSSSGAYPTAPAGWTVLTSAGSTFGVWEKIASGSEPAVNFSLGAGVCLAALIAVYRINQAGIAAITSPAVTAVSFVTGSAGNVTFTGSLPPALPGVTTVLIAADQGWGLSGWQNLEGQGDMSLVLPWTTQAAPFSTPVVAQNSAGGPEPTYNVGLGLSDYIGSPGAGPQVSSVQDASFWTAVLDLIHSIGGTAAASTAQGGAGTPAAGANIAGVAASATTQGGAGIASGGIGGMATPVTAQGGAGTPSGQAAVTGAAAPAPVQGGAGTALGQASVSGVAAPVSATTGAGTPAGQATVTGAAAPATTQGGAGTLAAGAYISGAAAPVTAQAGAGTALGQASITGAGAAATATAGAGTAGGSAPVAGTAAPVMALGGTGTPAGQAAVTGAAAPVTAQGGAGIPSGLTIGQASVSGAAAASIAQGGAGTPAGWASVSGAAATVTVLSGAGTPAGGAGTIGAAASVTAQAGAGTTYTGTFIGVAALVTAIAGTGTATGAGLTHVTITGTFPAIDGSTQDGYATFDPGTILRNPSGHAILEGAATTRICASVMIPITLPATDNTNLSPGPGQWAYTVRVHLGSQTLTWPFTLPGSLAPTVDLTALIA